VDGVHAAGLADSIDSADALLESKRIPGELEVHDQPAPRVQVEAFAGDIRRDEHPCASGCERVKSLHPFRAREAAVQHCHRGAISCRFGAGVLQREEAGA
jgi:hypothetical protein